MIRCYILFNVRHPYSKFRWTHLLLMISSGVAWSSLAPYFPILVLCYIQYVTYPSHSTAPLNSLPIPLSPPPLPLRERDSRQTPDCAWHPTEITTSWFLYDCVDCLPSEAVVEIVCMDGASYSWLLFLLSSFHCFFSPLFRFLFVFCAHYIYILIYFFLYDDVRVVLRVICYFSESCVFYCFSPMLIDIIALITSQFSSASCTLPHPLLTLDKKYVFNE